MADKEHLNILMRGISAWNEWREKYPDIRASLRGADLGRAILRGANLNDADLRGADLRGASLLEADLHGADLGKSILRGANLNDADLRGANLPEADMVDAHLSKANLRGANLNEANLHKANLSGADLSGADLRGANLRGTDLREANLRGVNLEEAVLVHTDFTGANLSNCHIFGISAWELILKETIQTDLVITQKDRAAITVDNLEVAQFIYLLLHNEKIRDVIDTITSKAVLILGRFTPERKAVLKALREALRRQNYTPILFDFDKPSSRELTETIVTLANLSRFIIADITDAKSIPQGLQAIVPNLPSVAVQPIILSAQYEYVVFEHFRNHRSVLPVYRYETQDSLLAALFDRVIQPAEEKAKELRPGS